jgi:hypothetical protein
LIKIEFAEELVGEWELGIEFDGFFAVLFRYGTEIEAEQKARGEEIGGGGIWRDLKHFGEGNAGAGVIFGLDVGDAEDVRGVNAGAGKPRLDFFEIGDGFGGLAGEIERKAGELSGFSVVGIFSDGAPKRCYGVQIIAFTVVEDAEFVSEIFCGGIGVGDFV